MTESTTGMDPIAAPAERGVRFERVYVWELPVRLFHWINAICLTVLFATGLYIAHPFLIASGEAWNQFVMGRVRQVHFAAAYVFTFTFLWRLAWLFFGNRYARSSVPRFWSGESWRLAGRQVLEYLRLRTGRPQLGHNALAALSYGVFALLAFVQILTGFALYAQSTPGGFWDRLVGWIVLLFGGVYNTMMWHHLFAWGFIVFVILHVYIVMLDGQAYRNGLIGSIVHGYKFRAVAEDQKRGERGD